MVLFCLLLACHLSKKEEQATVRNSTPDEVTQVLGIARIEPENGLLNIYTSSNGKVVSMPVKENITIGKGAVMLELDSRSTGAQVRQAGAKFDTQLQSIAAYEASAKTMLGLEQKAREDDARNQKLFQVKAITLQKLDDGKADLQKSENDYQKALKDLEQSKAKIQEINADISFYKISKLDKSVLAPCAGQILEWTVHLGDYATAGDIIGLFAPSGGKIAETEVDEIFADRVKLGMSAEIKSQATAKTLGKGRVFFVADFLKIKSLFEDENNQEDRRVRTVKIKLDDDCQALINSRVNCIIFLQ